LLLVSFGSSSTSESVDIIRMLLCGWLLCLGARQAVDGLKSALGSKNNCCVFPSTSPPPTVDCYIPRSIPVLSIVNFGFLIWFPPSFGGGAGLGMICELRHKSDAWQTQNQSSFGDADGFCFRFSREWWPMSVRRGCGCRIWNNRSSIDENGRGRSWGYRSIDPNELNGAASDGWHSFVSFVWFYGWVGD
jgi:hypothetical protein